MEQSDESKTISDNNPYNEEFKINVINATNSSNHLTTQYKDNTMATMMNVPEHLNFKDRRRRSSLIQRYVSPDSPDYKPNSNLIDIVKSRHMFRDYSNRRILIYRDMKMDLKMIEEMNQ